MVHADPQDLLRFLLGAVVPLDRFGKKPKVNQTQDSSPSSHHLKEKNWSQVKHTDING